MKLNNNNIVALVPFGRIDNDIELCDWEKSYRKVVKSTIWNGG